MTDSNKTENYSVGDQHPRYLAFKGHPEGAIFEIIDAKANITVLLDDPTPKEIQEFENGEIKTGLYDKDMPLFFFLLEIGIGKFSCPYDHSAVPAKYDSTFNPDEPKLELVIELLNRKDQTVVVKRQVKISPRQTRIIMEKINFQRTRAFNKEEHIRYINEVYIKFPTEEGLIQSGSGMDPAR